MILVDVNVLVYAVRKDAARHAQYTRWLGGVLSGAEPVGVASESLATTIRITTHRKLWRAPLSIDEAFAFVETVRLAPAVTLVQPGVGHWAIFAELVRSSDARGNLVTDAWLAALAIEQGCTLVTTDRDVARFPGLRWRHPLAA